MKKLFGAAAAFALAAAPVAASAQMHAGHAGGGGAHIGAGHFGGPRMGPGPGRFGGQRFAGRNGFARHNFAGRSGDSGWRHHHHHDDDDFFFVGFGWDPFWWGWDGPGWWGWYGPGWYDPYWGPDRAPEAAAPRPPTACGAWVWQPDQKRYQWQAQPCGAAAEAPPAAEPAPATT